jgi:hypothetical protein
MAHDDDAPKTGENQAPFALAQNPAPNPPSGQAYMSDKEALVQSIMATFRAVLPSNYVAQVNGPWYSLQFQAMAEQLAEIQISTTEIYKDSGFDFTRTDFLWEVLGSLVFPGATDRSGIPQIDGDTAYREFLHKMVMLLLQGATKASMAGGLEALDPDVVATITERYLETPPRDPVGAWTIEDQFLVDIFIEGSTGNTFPMDPFVLQRNAELVLAALKPAHVFYGYSYLFRDAFDKVADDTGGMSLDLDSYYYADLRKWCMGAQRIAGTGDTLSTRTLFTDPNVSFQNIRAGAILEIESGTNKGKHRVVSTRVLLYGADATVVAYTTSTGLSGMLTATTNDTVVDATQDWGAMPVDTTITLTTGPNAGTYRLDTVLGDAGGPIGTVGISGTEVRLSPSTLQLARRMDAMATGQTYTVSVDRLGVQTPRPVSGEDVTLQFLL